VRRSPSAASTWRGSGAAARAEAGRAGPAGGPPGNGQPGAQQFPPGPSAYPPGPTAFPPGPTAYPPGPTGGTGAPAAVQPAPEQQLPPAEPEPERVERRPGIRYCTVCGTDNEADRRFCRSCGNDLLVAVPVKVSWWRRLLGRGAPAYEAGARPGQQRRKREHRNRRVVRSSIAVVLITAIALLAGPFRGNVTDAYHKIKGKVTTKYQPVKAVNARSSSAAKGHPPTNAIDGVKDSAWAEGVRGDGVNESITLRFGGKVNVDRIGITPGASDNQKKFLAQPRPKQIRIEFSNGRQQVVTLTDSASFQQFDVRGQGVDFVRLVMIAMYPGQSGHDASIAEVEFFSKS